MQGVRSSIRSRSNSLVVESIVCLGIRYSDGLLVLYCAPTMRPPRIDAFFFFNDTATTEIYTLSLHDALPIWGGSYCGIMSAQPRTWAAAGLLEWLTPPIHEARTDDRRCQFQQRRSSVRASWIGGVSHSKRPADRKSTRLNSSHQIISYAVFCL